MSDSSLFVTEIFASIQGETSLAGLMTSFVRLSGCPLRCSWCDSTYTFKQGTKWTIHALIQKIEDMGWKHVCITGGEPLIQPALIPLLNTLEQKGFSLSLETGGAYPIDTIPNDVKIILDVKCPASGMSDKNHFQNFSHIKPNDEIKFVIKDFDDYSWAKEVIAQHNLFARSNTILFSPVWGILEPHDLVSWICRDQLPVRFNVQLHKYIWGSEVKGV